MKISHHRSLLFASLFGLSVSGLWMGGSGCRPTSDQGSSEGGSGGNSGGQGGNGNGGSGGSSSSGGDSSTGGDSGGSGGSSSGGDRSTGGATSAGGSNSSGGNSGGNGGTSSSGGSTTSSGGGSTGSAGECTGTAPSDAKITDFSDATGTTSITVGTVGGVFVYPSTGGPTAAIADGALHVTASVAASSYWGFGSYFTNCLDASAYSAVKFNLKGTTDCPMKFGVNMSVDDKDSGTGKAGCTGTACYGPNAAIAASDITTGGKDVTVTFDAQAGGSPVTTVGSHKAALTGIQWQFASSTAACTADVTVDNVTFVQ